MNNHPQSLSQALSYGQASTPKGPELDCHPENLSASAKNSPGIPSPQTGTPTLPQADSPHLKASSDFYHSSAFSRQTLASPELGHLMPQSARDLPPRPVQYLPPTSAMLPENLSPRLVNAQRTALSPRVPEVSAGDGANLAPAQPHGRFQRRAGQGAAFLCVLSKLIATRTQTLLHDLGHSGGTGSPPKNPLPRSPSPGSPFPGSPSPGNPPPGSPSPGNPSPGNLFRRSPLPESNRLPGTRRPVHGHR